MKQRDPLPGPNESGALTTEPRRPFVSRKLTFT